MDIVKRIKAGKNDWNEFEVGVRDGRIVIRDDAGFIDLSEDEIDALVDGLDKARRRIRELERRPTQQD